MSTILQKPAFFRLKAAMHDLIDRAGGIERAAELCGYSKSAVGRWHCRHAEDMMPIAAALALEIDSGFPLVTRAMAGLNGLECSTSGTAEPHVMGAYVALTEKSAALNSTVACAMADGVITPGELLQIDEAASATEGATERLRQTLAAAGGKAIRVVG